MIGRMSIAKGVLALCFALQLPLAAADAPPAVAIGGRVEHALRVDAAKLATSPRRVLDAADHGTPAHWEGVALADLLREAGVPLGDALRGRHLATYVRVTAADGYVAVFCSPNSIRRCTTTSYCSPIAATAPHSTRSRDRSASWPPATSVRRAGCARSSRSTCSPRPDAWTHARRARMIAAATAASAVMNRTKRPPSIHLRVMPAPGVALGPGKCDLLAGIRETGSIAAAGRRMHMSYRRAWQLVEELNRSFRGPLVEASKGGSGGGGARLTALGETVLERYTRMRTAATAAVAADVAALRRLVARDD